MPIVSINLSPRAYMIYDYLSKGRRASRIVSTLLINWDNINEDGERRYPLLELGDRRTMFNGDLCEWTDNGWQVVELKE